VTKAAVAAEVHKTLNGKADFPAEVTFDFELAFDDGADFRYLFVSQFIGAHAGIEARFRNNVFCASFADSVQVLKSNFDTLIFGQIDAGNTSHCLSLSLFMFAVFANDAQNAATADHFTFVANALH
jgi:hypothetical protein